MKRTITALYETQAQAERVRDALKAEHLGDDVTIRDQDAPEKHEHRDLVEWLGDLFGGHKDSHLYAEGLRRGHILLTVKVDDLNETRAAEILDASQPVDLNHAERSWRGEGWSPTPSSASPSPKAADEAAAEQAADENATYRVRIYALYE